MPEILNVCLAGEVNKNDWCRRIFPTMSSPSPKGAPLTLCVNCSRSKAASDIIAA